MKYKVGDYVKANEAELQEESFKGIKKVIKADESCIDFPYELQGEEFTYYSEESLLPSEKTKDDLIYLPFTEFDVNWEGKDLVKIHSRIDRDLVEILGKSKDGKGIAIRHIDYTCEIITLAKAFKQYRFENNAVFGREVWK